MTRPAALVAALVAALALPALAAAPRFWRFEGTSVFLKGELESTIEFRQDELRHVHCFASPEAHASGYQLPSVLSHLDPVVASHGFHFQRSLPGLGSV